MKRRLIVMLTTITIITALVIPVNAEEPVKQQLLVDQARITFKSFMIDQNMAWFRDHMHEAKGFLIIPELLQGAARCAGIKCAFPAGSGWHHLPNPGPERAGLARHHLKRPFRWHRDREHGRLSSGRQESVLPVVSDRRRRADTHHTARALWR